MKIKIEITKKEIDFPIEKRPTKNESKKKKKKRNGEKKFAVVAWVLSTVDGNGEIRSERETRKELEHNGTNSRLCDGMTS